MISIHTTLTPQDYVTYRDFILQHYYAPSAAQRRTPYFVLWILLSGLLLAIFSTFTPLPGKFDVYSLFYGFCSGLVVVLLYMAATQAKSKCLRELFTPPPTDNLFRPRVIEINADGISLQTELCREYNQWALITDLIETPQAMYLCLSKSNAFIIPLRDIQSEAQRLDILYHIKTYAVSIALKEKIRGMC